MQKTSTLHHVTIAITLSLAIFMVLPGCASLDKISSYMGIKSASSSADTPEALVLNGLEKFNHGSYDKALKIFTDVQERFPFSPSSMLAELKAADCHYYLDQYPEARTAYEEFEGNHPTNEALPYVLFQIARSHYKQIDVIDRDPGAAMDAIEAFTRLLKSFPDTPYTNESKARIHASRNFLANHEMYVAAYYIRTKEYDQAKGRLQYLLANYPETSTTTEASELLAAIESGNPPQRTWRDWIPDIGLPDWKTFSTFGAFGGAAAGPE